SIRGLMGTMNRKCSHGMSTKRSFAMNNAHKAFELKTRNTETQSSPHQDVHAHRSAAQREIAAAQQYLKSLPKQHPEARPLSNDEIVQAFVDALHRVQQRQGTDHQAEQEAWLQNPGQQVMPVFMESQSDLPRVVQDYLQPPIYRHRRNDTL